MPVQRVCRPDHTFRGFQGQIESGSVAVGDEITTLPSNEHAKVKSILVGDKQSETAFMGQPVTIQLDREVDVSRGCVLSKGTNLPLSKSFTATILWMDDNELTPGSDYLVKLGTKQIPAILKGIQYKIDVNTGDAVRKAKSCDIPKSCGHQIKIVKSFGLNPPEYAAKRTDSSTCWGSWTVGGLAAGGLFH